MALFIPVGLVLGWFLHGYYSSDKTQKAPFVREVLRPLDKYSIDSLSATKATPSRIEILESLEEKEAFESFLFSFELDPTLSGNKEKKKVTGLINVPKGEGPFPLAVLFRGYVDQSIYQTGAGSKRVGEFLSSNGYITIAPDFLGYAGSDKEASNIFESRFQTYTTALTLIESAGSLDMWDRENLFIWGHSNGGQIALTVLEITQKEIPTVLWAPVSKPFPYSVLYYTDASEDRGKLIRKELAEFEKNYDPDLYSIDLYLDRIGAPLRIHQGTNDDAVPRDWSDSLHKNLENKGKDVGYFVYPGADHNLNPSWSVAVQRMLSFFNLSLTSVR